MRAWQAGAVTAVITGVVLFWPREATPHNPVTTTVLFNREVVALFNQKCVQCHAPGKLAMPLGTFAQARPWAQAIKEEILSRRMPPWPAQRGFGVFANDAGLTTREFDFLISWVDGGTPEGNDPPPAHVDHSAHWMLGDPDRVVTLPDGVVVDSGQPPHIQRLVVDPGLTRETWLRGIDYKAGDARVTRAAFISIDGADQFVGGWTPGATATQFPAGSGVRVAAGSKLAVEVLYQSTDTRVTDKPQLGLYFSDRPMRQVRTLTLRSPAPSLELSEPSELLSVRLDPGSATTSFELRAKKPDGSVAALLRIKDVRPAWQTPFVFARPVALPKGTTLQGIATFKDGQPEAARTFAVAINSQPAAR